jgi:hypothetical protein
MQLFFILPLDKMHSFLYKTALQIIYTVCPGSSVVEQRIENPRVGSSILPPGTTFSLIYR